MVKRIGVVLVMLLLPLSGVSASAAGNQPIVGIHYWPVVHAGKAQSYNIRVAPPKGVTIENVYVVLVVHPDTQIIEVDGQLLGANWSDGWQCSVHVEQMTTVFCSTDLLTTAQTVGVHGSIVGPGGPQGVYALLRVGTAINGSPNQGWALDATYTESGTIPSALQQAPEPVRNQLFIPFVGGK